MTCTSFGGWGSASSMALAHDWVMTESTNSMITWSSDSVGWGGGLALGWVPSPLFGVLGMIPFAGEDAPLAGVPDGCSWHELSFVCW